jgi:hypothetical protein
MKKRHWKVIKMGEDFKPDDEIELACPNCGREASIPFREWKENLVIAAFGLNLVFDHPGRKPPFTLLPAIVQCRGCYGIFESKDEPEGEGNRLLKEEWERKENGKVEVRV